VHQLAHVEKPFRMYVFSQSVACRNTEQGPFACTECQETFITNDQLENHHCIHRELPEPSTCIGLLVVHTEQRPFTCTGCKETFFHRQTLEEAYNHTMPERSVSKENSSESSDNNIDLIHTKENRKL
jgi:hypothetical protein